MKNYGGDINRVQVFSEARGYVLRNGEGAEMFEITTTTDASIMWGIQRLFMEAFEAGRKTALRDVRRCLGVKE